MGIDEYCQYWLNVGLDCTPIDHAKAEALIDELYVYSGLKPPVNKVWFPSPEAIVKETGLSASNFFCGQHNAEWVSYYAYCRDAFSPNVTTKKLYQIIVEIAKHLHWYITGEWYCYLSERPLYVSFKDKLLHADGKPAILYQDGFAIYSLNGVSVSKEIAETPADKLDPEIILRETDARVKREVVRKIDADKLNSKILLKESDAGVRLEIVRKIGADKLDPEVLLKETDAEVQLEAVRKMTVDKLAIGILLKLFKETNTDARVRLEIIRKIGADELDTEIVLKEFNAEVRCEIVRKIGVERLEEKLKPRVLDRWGDYELQDYSNYFKGMRCKPVYLKMKNPSIGVWHYEGVNIDEMEAPTCQAALKWRLKGKDFKPIRIT